MRKKYPLNIIYEDNFILVCHKPSGLSVQTANPGETDMVSQLKTYRTKHKENPYIGIIHRLDQPVQGIIVFAKSKTAAANLTQQISAHTTKKEYLAVVCGILPSSGRLEDYLLKDSKTNSSKVVPQETPGAKKALLSYEVLKVCPETNRSLLRINLQTGRHHQIRVQFAHAGTPLYGDRKYGHPLPEGIYCPVALCSYKIGFIHPHTHEYMEFSLDCRETENFSSHYL